jgi:NgoMIV restriction enzyme
MSARFVEQRQTFHAMLVRDTLVFSPASKQPTSDESQDGADLSPIVSEEKIDTTVAALAVHGIASNADSGNRASIAISSALANQLGQVRKCKKKPAGQTLGDQFEKAVHHFLENSFPDLQHLRPGRWLIERITKRNALALASYQQYEHLRQLADLVRTNAELKTVIGNEYLIAPDIVIARYPESDELINSPAVLVDETVANHASLRAAANREPLLHASISCKWTIRSDRSQNARSEALNLIRNRKGRTPHVVVVTAEPLPSRIASIALGTGDIDCVYHFALPELQRAVQDLSLDDAADTLNILVIGKRLRDISDLPLDLAV